MPSERSIPSALTSYLYDPLDRLLGSAIMQRFYQNAFLITALQGNRAVSFLRHQSQPLAQHGQSSTLLATDQQCSVLGTTMTNPYVSYGPYGHRAKRDDSLLGFNGELPDKVSGHYPLGNGHRWFSPVLMRFNSPDRMSPFDKGGINAYCYCLGDPINRHDPSGKVPSFFKKILESALSLADQAGKNLPPSPTWTLGYDKQFFAEALKIAKTSALRKAGRVMPSQITDSPLYRFGVGNVNNPAPFTRKVNSVVLNKESHGMPPLPNQMDDIYIAHATAANAGEISSTTAHVSMAVVWHRQSGPDSVVATGFHVVAAAAAGVEDHWGYKTGKILREIRKDP
ncbi:Rhs family protein [Pseudomonas sp. SDI]|uniref:RHS repeat-associated core domain-containing protein n=1 Tax=Pseudomonas sp. SDI TaxID=2170734 RepID=UPI000DE5C501|nr:RHS repeat-associated core domain-containing protein [Pseudomonas sp. SDI]PWB31486.1 Rhs family protein [Pseudomonas sp. SDI]